MPLSRCIPTYRLLPALLGAETLVMVELDANAGEVIARLHRDTPAGLNDRVSLAVPESALYLFDATSGKAIPAQGAAV